MGERPETSMIQVVELCGDGNRAPKPDDDISSTATFQKVRIQVMSQPDARPCTNFHTLDYRQHAAIARVQSGPFRFSFFV